MLFYVTSMIYCKSGNIRGTLIFVNFTQNSASANSKTRENICDILYAHFGHVGVVYWPCMLMQMTVIGTGECVMPALFLCCPVACKCIIVWCQVFVQYKNIKWLSAQREFNNPRICFCAAKREKLIPPKLTAFTVGYSS